MTCNLRCVASSLPGLAESLILGGRRPEGARRDKQLPTAHRAGPQQDTASRLPGSHTSAPTFSGACTWTNRSARTPRPPCCRHFPPLLGSFLLNCFFTAPEEISRPQQKSAAASAGEKLNPCLLSTPVFSLLTLQAQSVCVFSCVDSLRPQGL